MSSFDTDAILLAEVLLKRSPAVAMLRDLGAGAIKVHVLSNATFVARTQKVSDDQYEVTLSMGVWLALFHLMSEAPAQYENSENPLSSSVRRIVSFSESNRVRVVSVDDMERHGSDWHWHAVPMENAQSFHERFRDEYVVPWLQDGVIDRRIELAVAFILLHEFWHVYQDHFRTFPRKKRLHDQTIELLADLRAACMFPGLVTHLDGHFGIAGKKRCNQLIASGFSIACAILCFQTLLRLGRGLGVHPHASGRLSAVLLLIAHDVTNRDLIPTDRDHLVAGMYLLLNSFAKTTDGQAEDASAAAREIPALENYLIAHPAPISRHLIQKFGGDSFHVTQ